MDESDVGLYSEKKKDFTPAEWNVFFEKIREMGEYTKNEFGIEVVYHPHVKSMVEYEPEIIRLMDYTGLRLCFDTGHHAFSNGNGVQGDPSAVHFLRKYAAQIAYLHFKQVDGAVYRRVIEEHIDADTAFDINVMCDLPDGIIDFQEIRRALDEMDFNGIAVVESDMPRATTEQAFASARRNLDYLREVHIIE